MTRYLILLLAVAAIYLWWKSPKRSQAGSKAMLPAVAAGLFAFAYAVWPLDAVPDVTPVGFVDDLLVLISAGLWIHRQWRARPQVAQSGESEPPPRATTADTWDPYRVLEVERGASRERIAQAYREQMKRYHPDRVDGLGPELQDVAHRKTLEIQRAYRELTAASS
ncbi:MAG: DnaJ domain-containing protein [Candidatus Binatia bacterium]